jgi:hypothetical protein
MQSSDHIGTVAALGVVDNRGAYDSFKRRTFWHLEKRNSDVDAFIGDRMAEASAVISGHKGYDALAGGNGLRLIEKVNELQLWLPTQPPADQRLWTRERVLRAALHKLFLEDVEPDEIVEHEGNLLVTAGITVLLNLLTGGGGTVFSNANARLGVGDSSTAPAVGQTDLQAATNKLRKGMNASYPIISAPSIDFQATFGSSEANFAWAEVGTFNSASGATMLNRVVQALGTKSSGATWTLTETITWS